MISYTLYENKNSSQWVTFVHGAGGSSSIWFKQVRDFKKEYNVLLLDLRGHGNSKFILKSTFKSKYTFKSIANDIIEVLDFLEIQKSHFVGISLGTILIRQLAGMQPERVESMLLGGAILKMNFRSQILMKLGNVFKYLMPYLLLYKFFAFVIMPNKNHKQSRLLFIHEAKKLCQKEFIRWFQLTAEINPLLKQFRQEELGIPTFYIMGEEDYMFLPSVSEVVKRHYKSSSIFIIPSCGHVVNVEQSMIFNTNAILFLQSLK